MSTFLDDFPGQWRRPANDYKTAAKSYLIVLDTNILLGLYRFTPQARNELLEVLSKVKDRLWIPHQVATEYYNRRVSAVKEHIDLYDSIPVRLKELQGKLSSELRTFANRISLSESDKNNLLDPIDSAIKEVLNRVKQHEANFDLTLQTVVNDDPILRSLATLLDGKTGKPFTPDEVKELLEKFSERVAEKIPPGFRDSQKSENSHGDYFVWEQAIRESISRKIPVLLVTNDTKDDWLRKEAGLTIGAHPDLISEMRRRSGHDFMITQLPLFLKSAKEELGAAVSEDTFAQANNLTSKPLARNAPAALVIPRDLVPALKERCIARLGRAEKTIRKMQVSMSEEVLSTKELKILEDRIAAEIDGAHIVQSVLNSLENNLAQVAHGNHVVGLPDRETRAFLRGEIKRLQNATPATPSAPAHHSDGQLPRWESQLIRSDINQLAFDLESAAAAADSARARFDAIRSSAVERAEDFSWDQANAAEDAWLIAERRKKMVSERLRAMQNLLDTQGNG